MKFEEEVEDSTLAYRRHKFNRKCRFAAMKFIIQSLIVILGLIIIITCILLFRESLDISGILALLGVMSTLIMATASSIMQNVQTKKSNNEQ